jgi:hypothetical protein
MPFAAVVTVKIEGDPAVGQKALEEVLVPRVKALPGFQRARFMRTLDGTTGVGAVTFDTEANAKAGLENLTTNRPPEAPAVQNTALYEVFLEV